MGGGALPVAALAATRGSVNAGSEVLLPQIQLGQYSISRLVCGANPFNAGSHLSIFVDRHAVCEERVQPDEKDRQQAGQRPRQKLNRGQSLLEESQGLDISEHLRRETFRS